MSPYNLILVPAFAYESPHSGVNESETPKELLSFIEKQENYIDQLEKESNYCRVSSNALSLHCFIHI